ncbi:MAG TPA: galactose-1-epimerase, partial [Anseongella sp.]|nr:galactose-1-epimerase [Anseongella sp.]
MKSTLLMAAAALAATACNTAQQKKDTTTAMEHIQLDTAAFSQQVDGKQVGLYFLKNKNGLEMAVTNYGAKVVS